MRFIGCVTVCTDLFFDGYTGRREKKRVEENLFYFYYFISLYLYVKSQLN